MTDLWRITLVALPLAAAGGSLRAHGVVDGGVSATGTYLSGLTHPVGGPDHFLAMLAIGFVSIFYARRDAVMIPAAFLIFMTLGFGVGSAVEAGAIVEAGIGVSVLFLGFCIWTEGSTPRAAMYLATAGFAALHGAAHGMEMPVTPQPAIYALGFLSGTAAIHIAGVLLASSLKSQEGRNPFVRLTSALIMGAGVYFSLISF